MSVTLIDTSIIGSIQLSRDIIIETNMAELNIPKSDSSSMNEDIFSFLSTNYLVNPEAICVGV